MPREPLDARSEDSKDDVPAAKVIEFTLGNAVVAPPGAGSETDGGRGWTRVGNVGILMGSISEESAPILRIMV
jgi:hypothetical protein